MVRVAWGMSVSRVEYVENREFDFQVPVAIIGAGAAGLVAALAAHENGADVIVIERDALPRGSTALSAGLIPAAGTRWQAQAGIADDPDRFASDVVAKAKGEPDGDLVSLMVRTAAPTLEWLADTYQLSFSIVDDFTYPGHSARRMHGLPMRSGEELIDALRQAVESAGIEILCQARATTLFADPSKRILGLAIQRPDNTVDELGCGNVILACNGYGGNKAFVAKHIPTLADALYFGHPGNQGDALFWGEALGAATRHLAGHQGHGSVAHPLGILITWATISEGGVQVNTSGHRFSNEARGYSEQAAEVLRQPEGIAWTVFDARIAEIARQFDDFKRAEALGAILQADDWGALAERMDVPAENLTTTMSEVAACKRAEARDACGRDFAGQAQLNPPFLAVKVTGALFHTQGGLVVNNEARVLNQAGMVLPNLFAAGGAACGVSGSKAAGYLSGNGLLSAVTLGRIAGLAASRTR
jgi:fumarate reductase flavoprotein subunit